MLRLKLTDGKTTCKAVEMRPLPDMSIEELPPGTKVCISNAPVKAGLLLLDSKSIKVRTFPLVNQLTYERRPGPHGQAKHTVVVLALTIS